ncbi:MAG: hypothetical protein KAT00_11585, partial [Planctomycetes bacterium]|nr:hypothetical protein [Planctomycetota bacterium]
NLDTSTQLYLPPLPNVYTDSKICLGGVKMSEFKGMEAAEVFEAAFIKSTSTDHLADTALAGKKYRNIIDAINKTKGKVPLKLLRKVKKYGEIFK